MHIEIIFNDVQINVSKSIFASLSLSRVSPSFLFLSVSLCVFLYFYLSLCISLSVCLSLSTSLYVWVSLYRCVCVRACVRVCVSLSLSLYIYIYIFLSLSVCFYLMPVSLIFCLFFPISFSLFHTNTHNYKKYQVLQRNELPITATQIKLPSVYDTVKLNSGGHSTEIMDKLFRYVKLAFTIYNGHAFI